MTTNTKSTEFQVSGDLADKLAELFQAVLSTDPSPVTGNDSLEDGMTYYFTTGDFSREFRESDIADKKSYRELINICEDIAADLESGLLDERKYLERIGNTLELIRAYN